MELLYYITVGIALFALTLIINLFFSLKKTDELVEDSKIKEKETKPVHVPKKPVEKRGKSLKTLKHDLKKQVSELRIFGEKIWFSPKFLFLLKI